MKTTAGVATIIYELVQASALAAAISGKVRKANRPAGSESEDIVINCLPIDNEQLQRCVVNVNVFVPPYKIKENGVETGDPDFARMEQLQTMAAAFFKAIRKTQDYQIEWEQMSGILRDDNSTCYYFNIRLRFQAFNID